MVLARELTEELDERAGPWRLTDWERFVQESCRARFGMYQPNENAQGAYIRELLWLRSHPVDR